jgi:hypothetical protein
VAKEPIHNRTYTLPSNAPSKLSLRSFVWVSRLPRPYPAITLTPSNCPSLWANLSSGQLMNIIFCVRRRRHHEPSSTSHGQQSTLKKSYYCDRAPVAHLWYVEVPGQPLHHGRPEGPFYNYKRGLYRKRIACSSVDASGRRQGSQ